MAESLYYNPTIVCVQMGLFKFQTGECESSRSTKFGDDQNTILYFCQEICRDKL